MKQRKRIYYNAQQRAIIWERYQQGDSLHDIAKFFGGFHSSIIFNHRGNDNIGMILDNVSVTDVNAPGALALLGLGLGLTGLAVRRRKQKSI
jgi:hypothetical protein